MHTFEEVSKAEQKAITAHRASYGEITPELMSIFLSLDYPGVHYQDLKEYGHTVDRGGGKVSIFTPNLYYLRCTSTQFVQNTTRDLYTFDRLTNRWQKDAPSYSTC